jgi:hypothetical protein
MKKLILVVGAICVGESIHATNFAGWRTNVTLGYSSTQGTLKADTYTIPTEIGNRSADVVPHIANPDGLNIGLLTGYGSTVGKLFLGGDFAFSYDTANTKVADIPRVDGQAVIEIEKGKMKYKPRFGLGVGLKVGAILSDKILGFIRFGADYNWAQTSFIIRYPFNYVTFSGNTGTWSIVPGMGVEVSLNEKISWIAQIDYKKAFSVDSFKDVAGKGYKFNKRPEAIVAKVGVSYKF